MYIAAKADVAYSDGGTTEVVPFPKADAVSSKSRAKT
jgi:hypothetical protein